MPEKPGESKEDQESIGFKRRYIFPENARWPVVSDVSTLVSDENFFVHSLFQTEPPPPGVKRGEVESRLVARFALAPKHFAEVLRLFVRQWIAFNKSRDPTGGEQEAIEWLKQVVSSRGKPPEA